MNGSAQSLRSFARGRREAATGFAFDAEEHRKHADRFRASGETARAEQQNTLARVKARSRDEALRAADSADRKADILEGNTERKAAAS